MFNLAYSIQEKEGWFNPRKWNNHYPREGADVLLLQVYQGMSRKKMEKIETYAKKFILKTDLIKV